MPAKVPMWAFRSCWWTNRCCCSFSKACQRCAFPFPEHSNWKNQNSKARIWFHCSRGGSLSRLLVYSNGTNSLWSILTWSFRPGRYIQKCLHDQVTASASFVIWVYFFSVSVTPRARYTNGSLFLLRCFCRSTVPSSYEDASAEIVRFTWGSSLVRTDAKEKSALISLNAASCCSSKYLLAPLWSRPRSGSLHCHSRQKLCKVIDHPIEMILVL